MNDILSVLLVSPSTMFTTLTLTMVFLLTKSFSLQQIVLIFPHQRASPSLGNKLYRDSGFLYILCSLMLADISMFIYTNLSPNPSTSLVVSLLSFVYSMSPYLLIYFTIILVLARQRMTCSNFKLILRQFCLIESQPKGNGEINISSYIFQHLHLTL